MIKYNPKESFSQIKRALELREVIEVKKEDEYIFFMDVSSLGDLLVGKGIQYEIV